ncbi:MAG: hypothetical protein HY788_07945 [Deltaproteobacteria bacterium]|nr:hypothetical protein [Deltaproteobacteria bacterium]
MEAISKLAWIVITALVAYWVVRKLLAWQMNNAMQEVVAELQAQRADSPANAVALKYAGKTYYRLGLRDYRPYALTVLLQEGAVAVTEEGHYYLTGKAVEKKFGI